MLLAGAISFVVTEAGQPEFGVKGRGCSVTKLHRRKRERLGIQQWLLQTQPSVQTFCFKIDLERNITIGLGQAIVENSVWSFFELRDLGRLELKRKSLENKIGIIELMFMKLSRFSSAV